MVTATMMMNAAAGGCPAPAACAFVVPSLIRRRPALEGLGGGRPARSRCWFCGAHSGLSPFRTAVMKSSRVSLGVLLRDRDPGVPSAADAGADLVIELGLRTRFRELQGLADHVGHRDPSSPRGSS